MKRRTLRFKLIAGGCLVVLLPLVVVGFIAEIKVSQTLEAEAGRQMLTLANANARMVEMTLSTELKAIEQIAASPILTEATIAARQGSSTGDYGNALGTVLNSIRQKRSDDYVSLLVIDKDGKFLSDSHEGALKGLSLNHKDVSVRSSWGKP